MPHPEARSPGNPTRPELITSDQETPEPLPYPIPIISNLPELLAKCLVIGYTIIKSDTRKEALSMKTLTLNPNKPIFKDDPNEITTPEAYFKANEKAQEIKAYRRYIYSQIDMISVQIEPRRKLDQWFIIKYMNQQKDLLIDQAEELYNEFTALEAQIVSYLESHNS